MLNFLNGGAGINFLCRQHGFVLKLIDAAVDHDLPYKRGIPDKKVRRGSRNFLYEAAMTEGELESCFERGAEVVQMCQAEGSNMLSFGEMGIGNTSPSSVWIHLLTGILRTARCISAVVSGRGFVPM